MSSAEPLLKIAPPQDGWVVVPLNAVQVELGASHLFGTLQPWMHHELLEIQETQGFVKGVQSVACETATAMGCLRIAAENGAKLCRRGRNISLRYKDLTTEREIAEYTGEVREVLGELRKIVTEREKLRKVHDNLVALLSSQAKEALKLCEKRRQELSKSVEHREMWAIGTESFAGVLKNVQSSNPVETVALLVAAPAATITSYKVNKNTKKKNEEAQVKFEAWGNIASRITRFIEEGEKFTGDIEPLLSQWTSVGGILEELENQLVDRGSSKLIIIGSDQKWKEIDDFWCGAEYSFESFTPLMTMLLKQVPSFPKITASDPFTRHVLEVRQKLDSLNSALGTLHHGEAVYRSDVETFVARRAALRVPLSDLLTVLAGGFTDWILHRARGMPMAKDRPSKVKKFAGDIEKSAQELGRIITELRVMLRFQDKKDAKRKILGSFHSSSKIKRQRDAFANMQRALDDFDGAIEGVNDLKRVFMCGILHFPSHDVEQEGSGGLGPSWNNEANNFDREMVNPYTMDHTRATEIVVLCKRINATLESQLNKEQNPVMD